ncbi:MAG: hypothetical protein PW786_09640 [Arachidicoccus sp.]|nr:hypothetical protein [Arachidicoccus sp.]
MYAQENKIIQGSVFGNLYRAPVPNVEVYSKSGNITKTNQNGEYAIPVNSKKDSIWFRFLNKDTKKFSVDTIHNPKDFEVRIYLPDYYKFDNELPTVRVTTKDYYKDSLKLREDYAKIFNRQTPWKSLGEGIGTSNAGNGGIGIDLDAIIGLFRFGYNHRQELYQKFALQVEEDRYIDHRFNKAFVEKITGLEDDKEKKEYMLKYRPKYTQLLAINDAQLAEYIKETFKKYNKEKYQSGIKNNIIIPVDSAKQ